MEKKMSGGILFVSWLIIMVAILTLFFAYTGRFLWVSHHDNVFIKMIRLIEFKDAAWQTTFAPSTFTS